MTNTPQIHATDHLNIGGDYVKPALERMKNDGKATQEQIDLVWWFFAYCKEQGYSLKRSASELGMNDTTTIYRVFKGNYEAKLDNICAKIQRYKSLTESRRNINDMPFVQTWIARKVQQVCTAAWISQSMAMIWGDSQTGKTFALMDFAVNNNHGATKYIRLPAKGGIQMVAKEIARACYVSPDSSFESLRNRILQSVDSSNLLIFDEVHEAFLAYQKTSAVSILEFIREIHDRRKCGTVLCMTNVGRDEIERGKLSPVLKQISRRGVIKVQLPDYAPESDFLLISKKVFNLEKPEKEVMEIIKTIRHKSGIGVYCHYLKMGARVAQNEGSPYEWRHFQTAYETLLRLSIGSDE